ncbi:MAG: hypothetical protein WBS24_02130 [Terriglobales bacterium]
MNAALEALRHPQSVGSRGALDSPFIIVGMNQSGDIGKARQFADTAYGVEVSRISKESQENLQRVRVVFAAQGAVLSGGMTSETARIHGERITSLIQARLNALMEGYDLHGVRLDEQLTCRTIDDLSKLRASMIAQARNAVAKGVVVDRGCGGSALYMRLLEQNVGMLPGEIKVQLDRKRLATKKTESTSSITVYHVEGDNSRVNVNSADSSVNVVTKTTDQIFENLRQQVESGLQEGNERTVILEKLTALEQSQGSPSFTHRYTDFIAAAANHMALLTPFIPALTEMLHKALG